MEQYFHLKTGALALIKQDRELNVKHIFKIFAKVCFQFPNAYNKHIQQFIYIISTQVIFMGNYNTNKLSEIFKYDYKM